MVIARGDVYWADLGEPQGSRPAKMPPVLIVSADTYNTSRLATVVAVVVTSATRLASRPGNVFLPAEVTGLPRDSVVNVTALVTLDKAELFDRAGLVAGELLDQVNAGLRQVLAV